MVKEVRGTDENGELGPVKYVIQPKILNTINVGQQELKNVQTGMYNVVYGSHKFRTGKKLQEGLVTDLAAKTGTAETFYGGGATSFPQGSLVTNLTLVGYAPAKNPEIALSVVVPYLSNDKTTVNQDVAKEVINAYFELKK